MRVSGSGLPEPSYLKTPLPPSKQPRRQLLHGINMWAAPGDGLNMKVLWTDTPYAMQRVAGLFEAGDIMRRSATTSPISSTMAGCLASCHRA